MAKKTKVYLALIAAGLLALAVDRTYLGASTPSSTVASLVDPDSHDSKEEDVESASAPRHRPAPKLVAPSKLSVPELHFPRSLPVYDPATEMRDLFARSDSNGSAAGNALPARGGSSKRTIANQAIGREAFQATHRIDAVMVQDSLKIAVVDGRWMRVGDVLDTCTLIRIEGDAAEFQCHDGDTVLSPSGRRKLPSD